MKSIIEQGILLLTGHGRLYPVLKLHFPDQQFCYRFESRIRYIKENPADEHYSTLKKWTLITDRKIREAYHCSNSHVLLFQTSGELSIKETDITTTSPVEIDCSIEGNNGLPALFENLTIKPPKRIRAENQPPPEKKQHMESLDS